MTMSELRKKLVSALTVGLTVIAFSMLPACSSSDESSAPPPEDSGAGSSDCERGDQGICCDIDPMQPGCGR